MFFAELEGTCRRGLSAFVFSYQNVEVSLTTIRPSEIVGIGRVHRESHFIHPLASNIGAAKHPCRPACPAEDRNSPPDGILSETGVIEKPEAGREIPFSPGEVAAVKVHHQLLKVH